MLNNEYPKNKCNMVYYYVLVTPLISRILAHCTTVSHRCDFLLVCVWYRPTSACATIACRGCAARGSGQDAVRSSCAPSATRRWHCQRSSTSTWSTASGGRSVYAIKVSVGKKKCKYELVNFIERSIYIIFLLSQNIYN